MAVDFFLKIPTIPGESKDDKHKDSIDILAWSWGMSQSGTTHMGGGGGAGKVSVQDLSFTKYIDKSSTELQLACCKGTHLDNALLTMRKAGDNPLEYLKIKMTDVIITSYSTGGSGGEEMLTENVSLNFAKVEVSYQEQDQKGAKQGGEKKMGYNMQTNKAV